MGKKIKYPSRNEYSLHTLAYYQKQGGIYSDILTILLKLRDDPVTSRTLAPNRVLNEATWLFDVNEKVEDPEDISKMFEDCWKPLAMEYSQKDLMLIRCVLFILLNYPIKYDLKEVCPQMEGVLQPMSINSITLSNYLDKLVVNEKLFFPKFKHLLNIDYLIFNEDTRPEIAEKLMNVEHELVEARFRIEELSEQLREQMDLSLVKDAEIQQLQRDLDTANETINKIPSQSALDSSITFKRILEYIKTCMQYKFTTQIFLMLNWFMRHRATDEEYQLLDEMQQYMMSQKNGDNTTVINNNNHGCNVLNEAHDPIFGTPLKNNED